MGELGDGTTEKHLSPICIFRDGEWLYGSSSAIDDGPATNPNEGDDPATNPTQDDDPIANPTQNRESDPVNKTSIEKTSVSVGKLTYSGDRQTPKITVKLGKKTLKKGTDYTVAYQNSKKKTIKADKVKNAGTYYVRIAGTGNYKGTVSKKFTIEKHRLDKQSTTAELEKDSYPWTGKPIKPAIKLYFNGKLLKKGADYKTSYLSNKNIGEGTVMVTGMGNLKNTRLFGFKIVKAQQPIKLNLNSDTIRFKHKDIKEGTTLTLTVKGVKELAPIKVTSSNPKIVAVKKKSNGKYVVAPKKPGTAKIKIQTTKATKHYAKTVKTIEVVIADRKAGKIEVEKTAYNLLLGQAPFNLKAKASGKAAISYSMSKADVKKGIAKVDSKGNVSLLGKAGTVTVVVSSAGTDFYKPAKLSVKINAYSVSLSDSSIYLSQEPNSSNCTLYALVNMMRRKAILDGRSDWKKVGEGRENAQSALGKAAWVQGAGLNNSIEYKFAKDYTFNAQSASFLSKEQKEKDAKGKLSAKDKTKLIKEKLIELLEKHPEGIECYDTGVPHAVLVTSYDKKTDTFYCFDSGLLTKKGKGIIKLSESSLGMNHDSKQDNVLKALGKYWYLK